MIVPIDVTERFESIRPTVKLLGDRVGQSLLNFANGRNYAYLQRFKPVESLAEKIESGRFRRWSELDDLFACKVIVPSLRDEESVLAFLADAFQEVEIRGRARARKPPEVFRFDSTRFIGTLKSGEDDEISRLRFEVQIHTAFEHAWSASMHRLTYKSELVEWRRFRLAAQIKAVVEQLDTMILSFDEVSAAIDPSPWPEVEIKHRLVEGFQSISADGGLPSELLPKDWSRFAENMWSLLQQMRTFDRGRPEEALRAALEVIDREVRELGSEAMPRAISLHQFCVGCLARSDLLKRHVQGFHPLVTEHLQRLYPAIWEFATEPFDLFS